MARILAIDYGAKRTGLAVTDPLQIIANPLATVPTQELLDYLRDYCAREEVETIVIGEPLHADGNPTALMTRIEELMEQLRKLFPDIQLALQDERNTSEAAKDIIFRSGASQKKRRDKSLVDRIAAVLILQEYLEEHRYR